MAVESPCTGVCKMSPATGLCLGCFRSLEEITAWSRADDDRKRAIVAQVEERKAAAGRTERAR